MTEVGTDSLEKSKTQSSQVNDGHMQTSAARRQTRIGMGKITNLRRPSHPNQAILLNRYVRTGNLAGRLGLRATQ